MIFPSYIFFLVFLPGTLMLWHLIRHVRARLIFLTAASYVFYGWWDYRFTALLLLSTIVDYVSASRIVETDNTTRKKKWLLVSLGVNLGALACFKYYDFFVGSLHEGLGWVGIDASLPLLNVVLPLGISFYTFQSMSYTIDIYRGIAKPAKDFAHFAAYVSMFPQLIAGPIVRYTEVEDQLREAPERSVEPERVVAGLWLFSVGLFKKIWIADQVAPLAEALFDGSVQPTFVVAWVGTLAYTVQLYFDFSGYSDMARGLGRLIGFEFPVNFNSPYKSRNISEFWNRWHITLSHWLRDYLYIPLGGSRGGMAKTLRNLLITMFLGGLWHGAGWTFVLWGLFHGACLIVHALWKTFEKPMHAALAVPITFVTVCFGWVLFRAPNMSRAWDIMLGMVGSNDLGRVSDVWDCWAHAMLSRFWSRGETPCLYLLLGLIIVFVAPNSQQLPVPKRPVWGIAVAAALLFTMTYFMEETPFLYFQF